jgi:SAM-dependent methyltransferase
MAFKPNFTRKRKRKVHGTTFWDREYANPEHLQLSDKPGEDLLKFTRWIDRCGRPDILAAGCAFIDVGCGNGRNGIHLAQTFSMQGTGIDTSRAAIAQAKKLASALPLTFLVGSAAEPLPVPDDSQSLALDMMTSHFLNDDERAQLRDELFRALIPGGFLFVKTFLRDEDRHTERLLQEHPGPDANSYIHPAIGVPEYVFTEAALVEFYSERFLVRNIKRSHRHRTKGGAGKRRTISLYLEKDY